MKIINSTVDRYTPVFTNASSHWVDVKWARYAFRPHIITTQLSFLSPWKHRAGAKWWGLSKPIWKREVKSHEDVLASFPRLPCGTQGRALQVRDRPARVRIFLYYRIFKTTACFEFRKICQTLLVLFQLLCCIFKQQLHCFQFRKKGCQPNKNPSNGFCLVDCCWCRVEDCWTWGGFKTLEQFYDDVVVAEKSRLQFIGGSFRRVVELVRISLRFRSSTGKLKELRIKCVVNPDGSLREKNLPLAMVLCPSDGGWQGAVQNCFQSKFGLSPELQKLCFTVDHQAYSYEETTADSSTIPGIPTVYKTHSTAINVKTTSKAEGEIRSAWNCGTPGLERYR